MDQSFLSPPRHQDTKRSSGNSPVLVSFGMGIHSIRVSEVYEFHRRTDDHFRHAHLLWPVRTIAPRRGKSPRRWKSRRAGLRALRYKRVGEEAGAIPPCGMLVVT